MQSPLQSSVSALQEDDLQFHDKVSDTALRNIDFHVRPSSSPMFIITKDQPLWQVMYALQLQVYEHIQKVLKSTPVYYGEKGYEPFSLVAHIRHVALDFLRSSMTLVQQVHTIDEAELLLQSIVHEILGFGCLQILLDDPFVSDIYVFDPSHVMYTKNGKRERSSIQFADRAHIIRILRNVERWDNTHSQIHVDQGGSFSLPSGLYMTVSPAAVWGKEPVLHIHRMQSHIISLPALVKEESLSLEMEKFLAAAVQARMNIFICGSADSGRTTLLNALCQYIPPMEHVVTVEDVPELSLPHVAWTSVTAAQERRKFPRITMKDMIRKARTTKQDRIIVSECIGDELMDILEIMHAGRSGTMTTFYAQHLRDVCTRLEMLCLVGRNVLSVSQLHSYLAQSIQLIVFVSLHPKGGFRVQNISEVEGVDAEQIQIRSVYHYEETGFDLSNGTIHGVFRKTDYKPKSLVSFDSSSHTALNESESSLL